MFTFVLWNSIVVMFLVLFAISKKVSVKRSIMAILIFSLMTWFVFGKGVIDYAFSKNLTESVYSAKASEVAISDDGYITLPEYKLKEPFHYRDLMYFVHNDLDEPTYYVDIKHVDNFFVRFMTGGRKDIELISLYFPKEAVSNSGGDKEVTEEETIDTYINDKKQDEIEEKNNNK